LFDFAKIWYKTTEFNHVTAEALQVFKVKGSKVKVTW